MTNRRDWAVLSLGLVVGAGAASLYWYGAQRHSKFIFDQNLKCQQIGKQFESASNYREGVQMVRYSPTRKSCVAEVIKPDSGGVTYIIQDLLSGETMFMKRCKAPDIIPDQQALKDWDAKFVAASR